MIEIETIEEKFEKKFKLKNKRENHKKSLHILTISLFQFTL